MCCTTLFFMTINGCSILTDFKSSSFHVWMQGIVGSGLCYGLMSWCVNKKGPVFTAAFTPFIQIFVAIFDFSILHEQIHLGRFFFPFAILEKTSLIYNIITPF